MRVFLYLAMAAVTAVATVSCKSKSEAGKAGATPYEPAPRQLEIVEQRWPGTSPEEVKQGQQIYTGKCTACHKNYEITRFSEKKWLHEIDDMAPRANLTAVEKLRLTKFILSYRETFAQEKK